jgi:hypothetical protein
MREQDGNGTKMVVMAMVSALLLSHDADAKAVQASVFLIRELGRGVRTNPKAPLSSSTGACVVPLGILTSEQRIAHHSEFSQ